MVRTRLIVEDCKIKRFEVQRAKYKHWFQIGEHKDTDQAFTHAIVNGEKIEWPKEIITPNTLFNK